MLDGERTLSELAASPVLTPKRAVVIVGPTVAGTQFFLLIRTIAGFYLTSAFFFDVDRGQTMCLVGAAVALHYAYILIGFTIGSAYRTYVTRANAR